MTALQAIMFCSLQAFAVVIMQYRHVEGKALLPTSAAYPNFSFFFFFFTISQQLLFILAITLTFEATTKTKFKAEGLLSKHLKN